MRRSKILDLLKDHLTLIEVCKKTPDDGAERILASLERIGMAIVCPPLPATELWEPEEESTNEDPDDDRYCGAV